MSGARLFSCLFGEPRRATGTAFFHPVLSVIGSQWSPRFRGKHCGFDWRLIAGGGLAGIGFTMALFIGNLAFSQGQLASAKLGILASSLFSATVGLNLLWYWTRPTKAKGKPPLSPTTGHEAG